MKCRGSLAYEYAGNEAYAGDSYDISDYIALGMDAFYAQAGDFMSEMSDFTSEMMQEMSDSLRDLMEEMGWMDYQITRSL